MSVEALNLAVGAAIQLQLTLPQEAPRDMVRVIGFLPGASLIVTTPTTNGSVKIVREGQIYKARMLCGDSVVGFEAKVLQVALKPYPHLHLQYPKKFEQIIVRNSARIRTDIQCSVRNTHQSDSVENYHPAKIVDLSESGVKLASSAPLGETGDMLHMNFQLEVMEQTEALTLIGSLCNLRTYPEEGGQSKQLTHLHGIQFKAVNRLQQVLLHAWVLEHLVAGAGDLG